MPDNLGEPEKTSHLFKDQTDTRLQDKPVSRFRPTYRPLSEEEKALHDEIKAKAAEMEALFVRVKPGRYNALAMTDLERAVMWIVKELTS